MHQLNELFARHETPFVIGLQEIKVADDQFPHEAFAGSGYHVEAFGQKGHYGVGLAAKRFAWWPEFGVVWSDDQLRAIAQAFADLCVHMGWDIDEAMGRFGPWLAIVVTVGVPSFVTWDAVQDRRAEIAKQAALAQKQATSAQHGDPQ